MKAALSCEGARKFHRRRLLVCSLLVFVFICHLGTLLSVHEQEARHGENEEKAAVDVRINQLAAWDGRAQWATEENIREFYSSFGYEVKDFNGILSGMPLLQSKKEVTCNKVLLMPYSYYHIMHT